MWADEQTLKTKTAGTLKWNLIDRVSTQVLYAITGIVLARELTQEEFGLVGAALVFQAFASLLIDSGFASALIQRKAPTRLDYSSVMWFNFAVAIVLYIILWFCAPFIADFYGDIRIVPISRVLFVSLIINAGILVQANILMKKMDVSKIAIANAVGLASGAAVGITLAFMGYGAWAIVWQTLALSLVKTVLLWLLARWLPLMKFSWTALRSFIPIASKMMFSSFLSTLFQNIYSLVVGNRAGMAQLGYYSQSDKWSKMSVTSISQTLTASFMPVLSEVQDQPVRFSNICSRFNRFTAYILFPLTVGQIVLAEPLFHALFGSKWDPSIFLFQLLILRGVFTVLCSLYNNYLLALGHAKAILWMEVLRDVSAIVALAVTLPYIDVFSDAEPTWGLSVMLIGQLIASALTWVVMLGLTVKIAKASFWLYIRDLLPYLVLSLVAAPVMIWLRDVMPDEWMGIFVPAIFAIVFYMGANYLLGSKIQQEVLAFLFGRGVIKR